MLPEFLLQTEFQIPISEIFLSRIMQSRICQRDVLCEVLQKYRRISETDFFTLSKDGLCKEILAIVEADVSCLALSLVHSFNNEIWILTCAGFSEYRE